MKKIPARGAQFKLSPLAALLATALLPGAAWALELAQSPPGTQSTYVAPNVIMSFDDSGSMAGQDMINVRWQCDRRGRNCGWRGDKTRVQVLREAVTEVFSDKELLPDGKIRLAWQTMAECNGVRRLQPNSTGRNAMRVLDQTHRDNFLYDAERIGTCGWTPTHQMMKHADQYLRNSSMTKNSPWASKPGEIGEPFLGCRRNYHILLTDGGWNRELIYTSPENFDGTARTLPDGTPYSITSDQTHIYRDTDSYNAWDYNGSGYHSTTIADWAFKSWADPLKPLSAFDKGIGPVPDAAYRNAPATETFTNQVNLAQPHLPKTATLEKYWNPKYNPATWAHMTTFTIGFSADAVPQSAYLDKPSELAPYGYDGSFANLANGSENWDASWDKGQDMWHAAINSRGQFYAVEKGEDLAKAFREIVKTINVEAEATHSAVAMSGNSVARYAVGVYASGYDPQKAWSGWIHGSIIKSDGQVVQAPGWGGKSTADHLDALGDTEIASRLVWSWNGAAGVPFAFDHLNTEQQEALWQVPPAGGTLVEADLAKARIAYVRGDRSREGAPLRARDSRQGDIVNSNIWYVDTPVSAFSFAGYPAFAQSQQGRLPMIYVGGNDGMLHGFSATDGKEKIAYVPHGVVPTLYELTQPAFDGRHRTYVDGPVMTGDVTLDAAGTNWRTVLVGALGAGGKGYYVLDVTNPAGFATASPNALVLLDQTMPARADHGDIGHIAGAPKLNDRNARKTLQIARLNNNRWAAIMGNGYNSTNRRPVLLIQYLDGPRELKTLVAANQVPGEDNGLATPTPVDLNGDGRPDVVYAGDNMGNVWKFMLADADDSKWGVAFGGKPLFDARANNPHAGEHPITAAPSVRRTTEAGGLMVAFGTGRNVSTTDADDLAVQSVYAVLDKTQYSNVGGRIKICTSSTEAGCDHMQAGQTPDPVDNGRTDLVAQSLGARTTDAGRTYWALDSRDVDYSRKRGWYLDLTGRDQSGERLLKSITFMNGGETLEILTQIPAKGAVEGAATESCEGVSPQSERQFFTRMHIAQPARARTHQPPPHGYWHEPSLEVPGGPLSKVGGAPATHCQGECDVWGVPPQNGDNVFDKSATPIEDGLLPLPARPGWWQLQ